MNLTILIALFAVTISNAFTPSWLGFKKTMALSGLEQIMEGVEYCNYIREWRFKWKSEASLLACQIALESIFDDLIAIDGVKNVERLVCDECQDFKAVITIGVDEINIWEKESFVDLEQIFFEILEDVDGVTNIESQTFKQMKTVSSFFDNDDN